MFNQFAERLVLPWLALACDVAVEPSSAPAEDAHVELGELPASQEAAPVSRLSANLLQPPRPVLATDDQRHLAFEVLLENEGDGSVRIDRIEIFRPGERAPFASFTEQALQDALVTTGGLTVVQPGEAAFVFMNLTWPRHARVPGQLFQRITTTENGAEAHAHLKIDVERMAAVVVGAPLRGRDLLAFNACCSGSHGRAVIPVGDELFLSQRYAIDFVRIDADGTTAGEPTDNASYFIYGEEVLAARAGEVMSVRDDLPDNVPTEPLPPPALDTAAGNFVVQRLDGGEFALYAHLKPGSVRVAPGQRLEAGQLLGLVGNTGNSTEPHLHFQVMDRPEPLAAQGVPHVFRSFEWQGRLDVTVEEVALIETPPPQRRRQRLPMHGDVVAFPEHEP